MRKIVLLATCAGLAVVAPASAGNLVETGKASVTLGWTSLDESNDESSDETDDQSYGLFGLDASYSIPLASDWSVQADILAEKFMISGSAENNVSNLMAGGLHVTYRKPEQYAIGAFAGAGFGETRRFRDEYNAWWLGAEAQYYLMNTTLYGQLAYTAGDVEDTEEEFEGTWLLRGVVRHFLDDNSKIEGELSYSSADDAIDDEDEVSHLAWGLGYQRQLMDSRWYYIAGYRGGFVDTTTEGEELTDHTLYLKMSFQFDDLSLKANDRTGASFDQPLTSLRATGWLEPLD